MPQLEISQEDVAVLRDTLANVIAELRSEINNTDAHDFRQQLKRKLAALERVAGALGKA